MKSRINIAVILNGTSLKKNSFYKKILPALKALFSVNVFETRSATDAISLSSEAVDKGFDIILSAGGDGTLNQVVNGVLKGREHSFDLPVLGVLPIGTGNDFARGMGAPGNINQVIKQLSAVRTTMIDVGKITCSSQYVAYNEERYFLNVADVGMGPEVVKKVAATSQPFGAAVAYYASIVSTFFNYKPFMLHAKADSWEWHGKTRTFAVANGKYFGHGLCIAPDASVVDGRFDVFVCSDVSVIDFIIQSVPLKNGKFIKHKKVFYKSAVTLELTSDVPCLIEADGEISGWLPARIEIMPRQLKFLL